MPDARVLALEDEPELVYRQLCRDLHAFASHTMDDNDAAAFMARLLARDLELELLSPVALAPPQSNERQALQTEGKVQIASRVLPVSPSIQREVLALSDEFRVSELRCLAVWFLASDAATRAWVERVDQLTPSSIAHSIPASARHLLISEVEHRLTLLKELLRLRFDDQLEKKRRQFVLSYTNKLLSEGLISKMTTAIEDELPRLMEISPLQQAASYWHDLLAEALLFAASSTVVLPVEILKMATALKALCTRLNTVVAKVSPHIVNLTTFAQLFESGSLAGTSPQGVVKQVSCMLRAMTTIQIAMMEVLMEKKSEKIEREGGEVVMTTNALGGVENARTVKELHHLIFESQWDQASFQSVSMVAWAAFLASQADATGVSVPTTNLRGRSSSGNGISGTFAEVEATANVVRAALENRVFTTLVEVLLKYLPDSKHDPLLYRLFERQLQQLFINYSSSLMVDVPTIADQVALLQMQTESEGEVAAWEGDCLENIIEFATALCSRDSSFPRSFWPSEDMNRGDMADIENRNCHEFLLACRDAAFKNPACLAAYLNLLAAAADGPDCAQLAFHHVKQNPGMLSWDQFFNVMNKYQRLLSDAERPAGFSMLPGASTADGAFGDTRRTGPVQKFIRPKELEALESLQGVIQAIIRDPQLAMVFFHNHDWSPIQCFVSFLQCRVPSSLKGQLMKTLSIFSEVPEVAPFVWRQMDSLQILRTTTDVSIYGNEDIRYELEHYESLACRYPATRGFVALLHQLFDNPHAWGTFEGDGRVAAIQLYFEFLVETVFLKFDLRKYEQEEEKWALTSGVLEIFKKILQQRNGSVAQGTLADQLLQHLLSGSTLLEKLFFILSTDGGVESLESTSANVHLEHAFFFCLDYAKKQTEATHGAINFTEDAVQKRRRALSPDVWSHPDLSPREECVQHALEILVLVLEKDQSFISGNVQRHPAIRSQIGMFHTILFRFRADFVNIVQYIKYTKSSYIPQLSVAILQNVSTRVSGDSLVNLLVDSGASGDIMAGYMNRLLTSFEDTSDASADKQDTGEPDGTSFIQLQTPKKRKRRDTISSETERALSSVPSIRRAILELFLTNLERPAPNVAHLLLGVAHGEASDATQLNSALDVVLTLLSSADFGLQYPQLAERCYHVVYQLLAQDFSTSAMMAIVENPRWNFFANHVKLFSTAYRVRRRRMASEMIAHLNMRGWFFKALSVYIHAALHKDPPHAKKVNDVMALVLQASRDSNGSGQSGLLLLQFLHESSLEIAPPDVPSNQQAVAIAEEVTETVDRGFFKWLKIDVERFCQRLQGVDLNGAGIGMSSKRLRSDGRGASVTSAVEALLQWAVNWNAYSERVAAESHSLNSLRELIEVIVLDYLVMPSDTNTPVPWDGLDVVASSEVRVDLICGVAGVILAKLTDAPNGCAQLFEIATKILLLLFAELRRSSGNFNEMLRRMCYGYVELIYKAIGNTATSTGNPSASQNARTLLYSCVVNLVIAMPDAKVGISEDAFLMQMPSPDKAAFLTSTVVDLICRDASEGSDALSVALAVSAMESMVQSTCALTGKLLRERGYLLHFIGVFRNLCDLDARFDHGSSGNGVANSQLPPTLDATTVGTMYECFLSFFARVAGTNEGAVALLEGGLVRALADVRNLPSHRPKLVFQNEGVALAKTEAYRRAEDIYTRKWIPVIRLLSALCSRLPQNRTLAQQVLGVIDRHRKLFTGSTKFSQLEKPSLRLLREIAYSSFILRYVVQFDDLCESALNPVQWEKICQAVLRVLLVFASEVVPPQDEMQMSDNTSLWWQKTVPLLANEERDNDTIRFESTDLEEEILESTDVGDEVAAMMHLSVFDEEKFFSARMIVCNAAAFCASRMLKAVDSSAQLLVGKTPLLSATPKRSLDARAPKFPPMDSVDRRSFAASVDPLWSHAPSLQELVVRLTIAVQALDSAKSSHRALASLHAKVASTPRLHKDQAYLSHIEHLIEYHADSLTFVVENMAIVLLTHFAHYVPHADAAAAPSLHQLLQTTMELLGSVEKNAFVHAIGRRLRELATVHA